MLFLELLVGIDLMAYPITSSSVVSSSVPFLSVSNTRTKLNSLMAFAPSVTPGMTKAAPELLSGS